MKDIEKLPYWDKLTAEEKDYLCRNAVVQSYDKGANLTECGGICLGMVYVLSGQIRVFMLSEEGREITLFHLKKGDSCVLSASCVLSQITFEIDMTATEKTELLTVNSSAFGKLMESNLNVKCFSYELALDRSSTVIWVLEQIIFAKFDKRLADYLLNVSEQTGSDEITMSKEAIAKEVNTAREVVSRMLKRFAADGLIEMNNKTIKITDKKGMKKIL